MTKKKALKTDINIHYLIPLSLIASPYETRLREAKIISAEGSMIRCQAVEDADQFEIHYFYDEYFQWLLHTGYIIPLS